MSSTPGEIIYLKEANGEWVGSLTFRRFSEVNMERHLNWPHTGTNGQPPQHKWGLSEWGCAVAEEAGEVCGAVKRINRLKSGQIVNGNPSQPKTMEDAILKLKMEIGDTIVYLDLLAHEIGSNLEECVRAAFNGVSEREGLEYKV